MPTPLCSFLVGTHAAPMFFTLFSMKDHEQQSALGLQDAQTARCRPDRASIPHPRPCKWLHEAIWAEQLDTPLGHDSVTTSI